MNQRATSVQTSATDPRPRATAVASTVSTMQRHWHCCRTSSSCAASAQHGPSGSECAERLPSTHARGSDASECRGSTARMPAQAQLPWLLMAQLHPTAVHPRGQPSIPRPRGTSDATAQQRVELFRPEKKSNITRHQGSNASAVSTTSVAMQKCDGFPHYPPDFSRAPPYTRNY